MGTTKKAEPFQRSTLTKQLAPTIAYLSKRYTSGIAPLPQVSQELRRSFYGDMAGFDRSMAAELSGTMVRAFEEAENLDRAMETVGAEFQSQMGRLSNILWKSDHNFRSYLALSNLSGYSFYVFLSEQSPVTCQRCGDRHGEFLTREDLPTAELPPLHLNCRCRLVAMDGQMAARYLSNRDGILAELDRVLDAEFGRIGGLFYLTHDAWMQGISRQSIRQLNLPPMSALEAVGQKEPQWYEQLGQWAAAFGADAAEFLDALFQRGSDLFVRADETMKENPLLGLALWADALAMGIPSGIWDGIVARWARMCDDPSTYNVLNFFTLGLGDLISGALNPEEPWSFQHFMDMLGLLTVIYGATKGITGALGADDALGGLDDTLDDAARAAIGSIDDSLNDAARKVGRVVKKTPADEMNGAYLKIYPEHEPPYTPHTQVYQVRLAQRTRFVRVYGGSSTQPGQWVINADDIAGLTAAQIKDKFALPQIPTHICDATVPADTILEISSANGILGGAGGGVQYFISDTPSVGWFTGERRLK